MIFTQIIHFFIKSPFSESLKCTNSTSTLRSLKLYEKPYTVKSIKYSRTHWLEQSRMLDDFRRHTTSVCRPGVCVVVEYRKKTCRVVTPKCQTDIRKM